MPSQCYSIIIFSNLKCVNISRKTSEDLSAARKSSSKRQIRAAAESPDVFIFFPNSVYCVLKFVGTLSLGDWGEIGGLIQRTEAWRTARCRSLWWKAKGQVVEMGRSECPERRLLPDFRPNRRCTLFSFHGCFFHLSTSIPVSFFHFCALGLAPL